MDNLDRIRKEQLHQKADSAMLFAFAKEWQKLREFPALKDLLITDFLDAHAEDGISSPEYAKRIGAGNLRTYANVLVSAQNLKLTRMVSQVQS